MANAPYIQGINNNKSTIKTIEDCVNKVNPNSAYYIFSYGTLSGYRKLLNYIGKPKLRGISGKWVFSFDYGRTDPALLKKIRQEQNQSVRIFNGAQTIQSSKLIPDQNFHMKACLFMNNTSCDYAIILGSSNFSHSGLITNIEMGNSQVVHNMRNYKKAINPIRVQMDQIWKNSDPLSTLEDQYTKLWQDNILKTTPTSHQNVPNLNNYDHFWLTTGYVTKNRGGEKAGNQIDSPVGTRTFFGFSSHGTTSPNTKIGSVTFHNNGTDFSRNLRLGDNQMEKITLPFPEHIGLDQYDGKVIEFSKKGSKFAISTYELNEYLSAFASDPNFRVFQMNSGRLYGVR